MRKSNAAMAFLSFLFLFSVLCSGITAETCGSTRPWTCDESNDQYCCKCDDTAGECCSTLDNSGCDIANTLATWIWGVIGVGIAIAVIIVLSIILCCCGCCVACCGRDRTTTTVVQSSGSASFGYGQTA
eukprot:m.20740 g.20740  ORF g.20740 m.20740 type:complete len:129 (+) comp28072_c0_seq1:1144-1530(+)